MSDCKILQATAESLKQCGELIRKGSLVAFPTETVYGLGANALNPEAVLKIFETKGRPLTDPLIVHVTSTNSALTLLDVSEREKELFRKLAAKFWPGPLTMILKAKESVPKEISANTGYIGVRVPDHKLARDFIDACGTPVAAPSANIFNHISPTTAAHVFNDFFDKAVTILDDGNATLGIESTVMKVTEQEFFVYRLGSLPRKEIEAFMSEEKAFEGIKLTIVQKIVKETETTVSPGQFIKHYAPRVPSFILTKDKSGAMKKLTELDLKKVVVVDLEAQTAP